MHASHNAWHEHNTTRKKNSHKIRRKKEKDDGKGTKIYNFYLIFEVI